MDDFQQLVRSAISPDLEEIKSSLARLIAAQEGKQAIPKVDENEYLTKKQVAKMLNCSCSTIDNYRRSGKLTPHYLGMKGKTVRFSKSEVIELVKS